MVHKNAYVVSPFIYVFTFIIAGVDVILLSLYVIYRIIDVWRKYYVNIDFNAEICMNLVLCSMQPS